MMWCPRLTSDGRERVFCGDNLNTNEIAVQAEVVDSTYNVSITVTLRLRIRAEHANDAGKLRGGAVIGLLREL